MSALISDIKYSLRMLAKTPGFTAVAVITLALGIGASTAIFSGVNALWLNPVPAAEADRLVQIRAFDKEKNDYGPEGVSPVIIQELRGKKALLPELVVMRYALGTPWENAGWIESIDGARVSPSFFSFWRAKPMLGRTFAAGEGRPGNPPVVVISHAFWKNQLGGDPARVGKEIRLGNQQHTVIGVMPTHFRFPNFAQFWVPADDPQVMPQDKDPEGRRFLVNFPIIARLAPGVSMKQAQAMLDVLARQYEEEHRKQGYGYTFLHARPMRAVFMSDRLERTIPGFVGAMIFVLLIACANVANLNLARTEARQHELAIRGALGAGRFQLLRQLLLESLLVALAGALAGIVLTYWSLGLMEWMLPPWLPRLRAIQIDWEVLAYSLLVAVTAGLVSGTVPAWYGATRPVANALKHGGVQATPGILRNLYRRGLVVVEVSLAMLLVAGAGLMIQSVVHLLRINPGFEPMNLLKVGINPGFDSPKYRTLEAKNLLLAEVHRRMIAVPGVETVGFAGGTGLRKFAVTGREEPVELCFDAVGVGTADPFKALRVPLLRGRCFDEQDLGANATAVVVNETLARRCWPGENALGKTIRSTEADNPNPGTFEVVGVVADFRHFFSLTEPVQPLFYRPHQVGFTQFNWNFYVRTRSKPEGLIKPLLAELKVAGPELRKPDVFVVEDLLYESTRVHRTYMCYLAVFGAVGLLLAGAGVYAILAHSVALREREIGIRMALGVGGLGVLRMVMRQGMTLVGIGIGLGLGGAWALTRVLRGMLYGVSPMDPLTLAAGALLLSLIALAACYLPARRAAKVDPMVALRWE